MFKINNTLSTDIRGKYSFTSATEDFLVEVHYVDLNQRFIQWHWHDAFEAGLIVKGSVEINVESEKYTLREGDGYILKSEILHSITPLDGNENTLYVVLFHPKIIGGSESCIIWKKYLIPLANDPSLKIVPVTKNIPWEIEARSLIINTWRNMTEKDPGYEFLVRNDLSKLIYLCYLNSTTVSTLSEKEQRDADRLRIMLDYIQEHFDEELTTAKIAQSAMISESECQRCFKRLIQNSPIRYLRKVRLQKSAEMLADKTLKISDIALKCGFQDMSYYSNSFKRMYGRTPGEYRASL